MKMLTFMTFVVLTTNGYARTPMRPAVYTAELRTIDIAEEGHLASGGQVFQHGSVTVDQINQKLKLSIGGRPVCAPGMMCPMVIYGKTIELNITKAFVDECKSIHYVAKRSMLLADGMDEKLEVIDNRNNKCPTLHILPATEIIYSEKWYTRMGQGIVKATSTFTAEELERVIFE